MDEPPDPDADADADGVPTAREAAYDAFVDLVLGGDAPAPDAFLAARGLGGDGELRVRLDAVRRAAAAGGPSDAVPFERLGAYRVLRRLDSGGMATVYLAVEERLGRLLALKVLRPEHRVSATASARFEREAQVVARLRHPNIVTIFAVGEEAGTRFLAMEYVEGEGLDEAIRRARDEGRRLPVATCVRWAIQVAGALQAAHEAGVVHRDVKPSNVRITKDGDAILLDFGIAAEEGTSRLTVPGRLVGTPAYAAPEQLTDARAVDGRTDVHALGVVLYEALTGAHPFEGAGEAATIERVLRHEMAPARALRHDVPRDLETVVGVATERDPARRYASAAAFAEDLRAVLAVRPIAARPPGPLRRAWKAARRHPVAAIALVVVLLTAVALGVVDRVRSRAAAREALDDARAGVAAFREKSAEARAAEAEHRRLDLFVESVYMTPEEDAAFAAAERAVLASRRAREELFHGVLEDLRRAERMDPGIEGTEDVRGALYVERWRDAQASHDDTAAAFYRGLAAEHGRPDDVGAAAAGTARIVVTCDAPGATARIFRWELLSELAPDGEARLVPVPLGAQGDGGAPAPGVWAFRLVRGHGPLLAGDLVTRVDGRAPGEGDWRELRDRLVSGASVEAVGATTRGQVDLPPGADVRITTQPLVWTPGGEALGTAPTSVPAAAILAVVRAPGCREARYALRLERGAERRIDARLVPEDGAPAGFVRVVPDVQAGEAPYWIQEREVTAAEYLEFLNDPSTLAEVDASPRPLRFPRSDATLAQGGHWPRGADGRYSLPPDWPPDWPALGVSCDDAEAYCAWWTRRERARGGALAASLPTLAQWFVAGAPLGERLWVFGNRFYPKWVASCFAHERASPRPVMRHPRDESILGVFDLSGSVWEWSATWWDDGRNRRRVCGGSWSRAPREMFKVWGGHGADPRAADDESGFRLVLTEAAAAALGAGAADAAGADDAADAADRPR